MKRVIFLIFSLVTFYSSIGQNFAIAAEKLNVLYIGVDNPLTIAVENTSSKSLIVKATRGDVTKIDGKYIYRLAEGIGPVDIIIYKKINSKLQELGRTQFRVKRLPLPVFKIGSGRRLMDLTELTNQNYARAEWENIEIDMNFNIEEFTVEIFSKDSIKLITKINHGNRISDEIKNVFRQLHSGDIITIKSILITFFKEKHIELDDRTFIIK